MMTEATDLQPKDAIVRHLLLVKVTIHQHRGRQRLDQVGDDIAAQYDAKEGSVRAYTGLFPDCYRKPIVRAVYEVKKFRDNWTRPWGKGSDETWRALPTANWVDFSNGLAQLQDNLRECVEELVNNWDHAQELAKAEQGKLYDPDAWPEPDEVLNRFHVELQRDVISDPDHIQLQGMDEEAMEGLKQSIHSQLYENVHDIHQEMVRELLHLVTEMADRTEEVEEGKPVRKPKGVLDAIKGVVESFPALAAVTGDKKLTLAVEEVRKRFADITSKEIRRDESVRQQANEDAKKIRKDLKSLLEGVSL